jgi:small subunit ribosomal protein S20
VLDPFQQPTPISRRRHAPACRCADEVDMANTKSAKKMTRKIAKRTEVNKGRRSRMRTFLRKVEEAIAAGDQTAATEALRNAEPEIMRAAQKGIVHKNMASRKVSRLAARVRALAA